MNEDEFSVDEQTGLGGEAADEYAANESTDSVQGGVPVTGALTPDQIARAFNQAQTQYTEATGQQKTAFTQYMQEIEAAKRRLLALPTQKTRQEYIQGLAQKLTTPKASTDPRFYERQTLGTFLRDIGQYDAESKAAERKAAFEQAQGVGNLSQLAAKYQMEQSAKEAATAASLMRGLTARTAAKPAQWQSGAGRQYLLPDGSIREQVFNPEPGKGPGYIDDKGEWQRAPEGSKLVTSSALNPESRKQFDDRQFDFQSDVLGLKKLQNFSKNVSASRAGFAGVADQFIAGIKSATGQKLSPEQFARLSAESQQQALLGAMRVTALGPGALSNYDAERLIKSLGGDFNLLFNKEIMASRMQELFEEKLQRAQINSGILQRTAPYHGYNPKDFAIPQELTSISFKAPKTPAGGKPKPPSTPAASIPETKIINGQTWTLHTDANNNKAYVSPDGKQFQEVP